MFIVRTCSILSHESLESLKSRLSSCYPSYGPTASSSAATTASRQPPDCLIGCRSEIVSWLESYSELDNTVGMVIAYQKSDNPANTINQVPTIPYLSQF